MADTITIEYLPPGVKLSGGQIAGIVIGTIVFLMVCLGLPIAIYCIHRHHKKLRKADPRASDQAPRVGEADNDLFTNYYNNDNTWAQERDVDYAAAAPKQPKNRERVPRTPPPLPPPASFGTAAEEHFFS